MDNPSKPMESTLISTSVIENGVVLKLFDDSKQAAPDHWQVTLTARLEIPLETLYGENALNQPPEHELRNALGDPLIYVYKSVRNFIPDIEKTNVLTSLVATFNQQTLPYISRPVFHRNHAIALYKEHVKRKTWYPDQQTTE
jgi:hypothetical protein